MGQENYPPEETDQYFRVGEKLSKVWYNLHACPIVGHNPALCPMKALLLTTRQAVM